MPDIPEKFYPCGREVYTVYIFGLGASTWQQPLCDK